MATLHQIDDPVNDLPDLRLKPITFPGAEYVGNCPSCKTEGTLLYTRSSTPQWVYCCGCGMSDSAERMAGVHNHGSHTPRALWEIYRLMRLTFIRETPPASLRMRFAFSFNPHDPARLSFYNFFFGFCELGQLRDALRERDIKLAASELPRQGLAVVVPCCLHPGYITGFWAITADEKSGFLMRANYADQRGKFYLKVRPSLSVLHYTSFQDAVDHGPTYASSGFNVLITAEPRLDTPGGPIHRGVLSQRPLTSAKNPWCLHNDIDVEAAVVAPPTEWDRHVNRVQVQEFLLDRPRRRPAPGAPGEGRC
jgi:hypothetical protein